MTPEEMAWYEARAAQMRDEPDPIRDAVPTGPTLQPAKLVVRGDNVKVHFFAMANNDWNLAAAGIGIRRGMTGKGDFSFWDEIKPRGSTVLFSFSFLSNLY